MKSADFSANLDFSPMKILQNRPIFPANFDFFHAKIPRNRAIFHEFATENPTKFCFFSAKYQKPWIDDYVTNNKLSYPTLATILDRSKVAIGKSYCSGAIS